MKRQIRRGCFESNSSSQHSLVIKKKSDYYTPEEIKEGFWIHNGVWKLYDFEMSFGNMPFRIIATFKAKWEYACASLCLEYKDDVWNELERLAIKYVPDCKEVKPDTTTGSCPNKDCESWGDSEYCRIYGKTEQELIDFLQEKEEKYGIEIDYWTTSDGEYWHYNEYNTGVVDEEILSGFLNKNNITLEEFLTNKKYVIIQDGDEYCYWQDAKDSGLINLEEIEKEYPKYD